MKKSLHVESYGEGSDIVLLHGWGFHSSVWKSLVQSLSVQYCVHCIDLPGFGRSQFIGEDYTMENIVEIILSVAPSQATWIGWSLGGMISTLIAAQYPERVDRLVNVASSPRFIAEDYWFGVNSSALQKHAELLRKDYQATLKNFLILQFYQCHYSKTNLRQLMEELFQYGKPDERALFGGLDILLKQDLRTHLSSITSPILHIFGKLDVLVPVSAANSIQGLNPNIQTEVISGAGHAPFLSHPEEFLTVLQNFL
ncbi:MAG: pimeloyl-ACP methyl ester esterase BioH [Proteobacteria bacterium]|nr:pimeloyl-ACP methyl ester esterase BioH [Pseudomonadota bacterium]